MARVGSLFKIFISKVTDYLIVVLFLAYFDSKRKDFTLIFMESSRRILERTVADVLAGTQYSKRDLYMSSDAYLHGVHRQGADGVDSQLIELLLLFGVFISHICVT